MVHQYKTQEPGDNYFELTVGRASCRGRGGEEHIKCKAMQAGRQADTALTLLQTKVVSRWFVMPMEATSDAL